MDTFVGGLGTCCILIQFLEIFLVLFTFFESFLVLRASAQTTKKRNEGEGSNNCVRSFTPLAGRLQGIYIASGVCSGEYLAEIIYPEESDLIGVSVSLCFLLYCCSLRKVVLSKPYVVQMQ